MTIMVGDRLPSGRAVNRRSIGHGGHCYALLFRCSLLFWLEGSGDSYETTQVHDVSVGP
jgi:hypothetical protein